MSSGSETHNRDHLEAASLYVLQALPGSEIAPFETHLSTCSECRREIETLRPVIASFVSWPTDILRPPVSLWERLSRRVSEESGVEPISLPPRLQADRGWEEVAKGLLCKLLSVDEDRSRVTMLVRLAPGTEYPAHRHSDFEELHLLHGELQIDDKKLHAGDFIRAEGGSADHRVWTETGCTCLLLTSLEDTIL
jgi:quercetin dioxygenase-like cupin family protein